MEETTCTSPKRTDRDTHFDTTTNSLRCFRGLIPAKAVYFFFFFTYGSLVPFLMLFYVSMGLTISQAGLLNGIRLALAAIISIAVGLIVDYTGKKKLVLITLLILYFISIVTTPFALYPFYKKNNNDVINHNTTLLQKNFSIGQFNNVSIDGKIATLNRVNNQALFYFSLFWFSILAITGFPSMPLVDSAVTILVKSHKGKASYGMQRVFAPIGYIVGSLLSGFIVDAYTPNNGLSKYTGIFLLQIPNFIFSVLSTIALNMRVEDNKDGNKGPLKGSKESILKHLLSSCKDISFIVVLFTVFINGVNCTTNSSYLLLLLKDMKVSNTAMGLTVALASVGEIVTYLLSKFMVPLFGGVYSCLCIAVFSYSLRFSIYYFGSSLWHLLLAQLLDMFGNALFWVAVIEYLYKNTSNKIRQSMFSLVDMLFHMISSVFASVVGGYFYDLIGGRKLFMLMSITSFCWLIVMIAFYIFVEKHKENQTSNGLEKMKFLN